LSDTDDLQSTAYAGHRATVQFRAIPTAREISLASPGGVIDLDRDFWSIDLHVADNRDVAGTPLQTTLGISYDDLQEQRLGLLNFIGGVRNSVVDGFAQSIGCVRHGSRQSRTLLRGRGAAARIN
jgi:hypothetical protein